MAYSNIVLQGATYPTVPGIRLPNTNNSTTYFADPGETDAVAADVASGKKFLLANGNYETGTASGGGSSNVVQGTFTTGSTRGQAGSVSIPYNGSGYPIALLVYVDGGAYNNSTGGNTDWYNSVNRYDVGWYGMVKSRVPTTPTFSTSGADNQGTVAIIYKNSTSTATTYTRTSSMTANTFSSSNAAASTACIRMKGNNKTMSYYVGNLGSGSIGLAPSTKYAYIAIYSS